MDSEHKWPGSNPDSPTFPNLCNVHKLTVLTILHFPHQRNADDNDSSTDFIKQL